MNIIDFVNNTVCPVSNIKINHYVSRVTVFMNAALLALYLITGQPLLLLIVTIDYGIRAAWNANYSPIRWIAVRLVNAVKLPEKFQDQAPKLFASRVGLLCALVSTLLLLTPVSAPVQMAGAAILCVFATLDSVFNFCAGCLMYGRIVLPFYQFMGIRGRMEISH